jgi:hypothetical protein
MLHRLIGLGALALTLSACATPAELRFENQRTVFNNPYVPPVIDQRGIGPACEPAQLHEPACTPPNVIYPGRGRFGYLGGGEVVRLTRADRKFLRDRAESLQARADVLESLKNGTPLPSGSPALPSSSPAPQSPRDRAPDGNAP